MKIERNVEQLVKDGGFRRSLGNVIFHKNMYFGLCYLHAVLNGRSQYGTLGWNKYYEFDANDFELSEQTLGNVMKKEIKDQTGKLFWFKYMFAKINFAGKITNFED